MKKKRQTFEQLIESFENKQFTPKFDDCRSCVFFRKRGVQPPACGEYDNGEFFEERLHELRPERLRLKSQQSEQEVDYDNVSDE